MRKKLKHQIYNTDNYAFTNIHRKVSTVKPILRGHHWEKKKPCKTGDLLKEVQFI